MFLVTFYGNDKTLTKITSGQMGLFDLYSHITLHFWGNSGQELNRNIEGDIEAEIMEKDYLLACLLGSCSASLLLHPRTTFPGVSPVTVAWACPHQLLIKKKPYRLTHRPIWWSQFLSWESLFSGDSSFCQLKKMSSTHVEILSW